MGNLKLLKASYCFFLIVVFHMNSKICSKQFARDCSWTYQSFKQMFICVSVIILQWFVNFGRFCQLLLPFSTPFFPERLVILFNNFHFKYWSKNAKSVSWDFTMDASLFSRIFHTSFRKKMHFIYNLVRSNEKYTKYEQ